MTPCPSQKQTRRPSIATPSRSDLDVAAVVIIDDGKNDFGDGKNDFGGDSYMTTNNNTANDDSNSGGAAATAASSSGGDRLHRSGAGKYLAPPPRLENTQSPPSATIPLTPNPVAPRRFSFHQ